MSDIYNEKGQHKIKNSKLPQNLDITFPRKHGGDHKLCMKQSYVSIFSTLLDMRMLN